MGKLSDQFLDEKPWAILGISRKQYETVKPWKKSNMTRIVPIAVIDTPTVVSTSLVISVPVIYSLVSLFAFLSSK